MVELRETGNIMADMARMMITSGANGQKVNGGSALINAGQKKPPELKATLYTWRERLPNKWDALKDWDDIFCWRTEVGGDGVIGLAFYLPPETKRNAFWCFVLVDNHSSMLFRGLRRGRFVWLMRAVASSC